MTTSRPPLALRLTADDARAMLLGLPTPLTQQPGQATTGPVPSPAPSYAKCANCGERHPGLLTFATPQDWQDDLVNPAAVQAAVKALRRLTGRASIFLCSWCVSELDVPPAVEPNQLRLDV